MSFPANVQFPFVRRDTSLVRACNERLKSNGHDSFEMLLDTVNGHYVVARWDGTPRIPIVLVAFTKPSADRRHKGDLFVEVGPDDVVVELGKLLTMQKVMMERTLDARIEAQDEAQRKVTSDAVENWYNGEHDAMDQTAGVKRKALRETMGSCETDGRGPNHGSKFYGPQFDRNAVVPA